VAVFHLTSFTYSGNNLSCRNTLSPTSTEQNPIKGGLTDGVGGV
jgi:hypothetical protein